MDSVCISNYTLFTALYCCCQWANLISKLLHVDIWWAVSLKSCTSSHNAFHTYKVWDDHLLLMLIYEDCTMFQNLWNKSRLCRRLLNLSVYLGNLPCVMSPEHSAVWYLWCQVLKYACIFSMRLNVNIFTVRALKFERLHIMALIYQISLQQNSGRTLISMHRSVFINLDASVGRDQISRQGWPRVRKFESAWTRAAA